MSAKIRGLQSEVLALKAAYIKSASILTTDSHGISVLFYIDSYGDTHNTAVITLTNVDGLAALTDVTWDGDYYGYGESGPVVDVTRIATGEQSISSFLVRCSDYNPSDWGRTITVDMTATATSGFTYSVEYRWGAYDPQW